MKHYRMSTFTRLLQVINGLTLRFFYHVVINTIQDSDTSFRYTVEFTDRRLELELRENKRKTKLVRVSGEFELTEFELSDSK